MSVVKLLRRRGDTAAMLSPLPIPDMPAPSAENNDLPVLYNHAFLSEQAGEQEEPPTGANSGDRPLLTTASPPSVLRGMVAEYLDGYTEPPCEVLDRKTGEIRTVPYVHTVARFIALLNATMPHTWSETGLRNVYRLELKARKADYWCAERAKLRAMDAANLDKAICARQRGLARNIGRKLEGRWRRRLALAEEERARRGLPAQSVTPQKRRPGRVDRGSVPVHTSLGLRLAVGEAPAQAGVSTTRPAQGTASEGAVPSKTNDSASEIGPALTDAWLLIARLKALRDQREGMQEAR